MFEKPLRNNGGQLCLVASWRCFLLSGVSLLLTTCFGWGQSATNTVTVFRTSELPSVLTTDMSSFLIPTNFYDFFLEFEFGFSTDEAVTNTFVDSFSATMQTGDAAATVVYLTADASGVQWAPPTPGTISVDSGTIIRQEVPFPSLEPVHAQSWSYRVVAPIPSAFQGQTVNFYFDFYNNLDGIHSLAWFSPVTVTAVPEPGAWSFAILPGFLLFLRKRAREKALL